MARSSANSFDCFLIERVPRSATRASAPTWSTPGSPWRKRRSADSDAVASTRAGTREAGRGAGPSRGQHTHVPPRRHLGGPTTADGRRTDRPPAGRPARPRPTARMTARWTSPSSTTRWPPSASPSCRTASTTNAEFRQALDGLAGMLIYEATRHLPTDRPRGDDAARPGRRPTARPRPDARAHPAGRRRHGGRRAPAGPRRRGGLRGPGPGRGDLPAHALPGQAARAARRPAGVRARPDAGHRRLARAYTAGCSWRGARPNRSPWCACWPRPRASSGPRQSGIDMRIVTAVDRQPPERAGLHRPRPRRRRRPPVRPLVAAGRRLSERRLRGARCAEVAETTGQARCQPSARR